MTVSRPAYRALLTDDSNAARTFFSFDAKYRVSSSMGSMSPTRKCVRGHSANTSGGAEPGETSGLYCIKVISAMQVDEGAYVSRGSEFRG